MKTFNELLAEAENGNPCAIYEVAQLYNSGEIPSSGETYIIWLKKFFENEIINDICSYLEDEGGKYDIPIFAMELYPLIIEAGIVLGLYYRNSSSLDELTLSRQSFYYAWLASKSDYIVIEEGEMTTDILSLMSEVTKKIESICLGGNDDD